MEPDRAISGDLVDIVESPDTKDFETGLLDMAHYQVHVGIVFEEGEPVGVAAGEVLCMAVDYELKAFSAWYLKLLLSGYEQCVSMGISESHSNRVCPVSLRDK